MRLTPRPVHVLIILGLLVRGVTFAVEVESPTVKDPRLKLELFAQEPQIVTYEQKLPITRPDNIAPRNADLERWYNNLKPPCTSGAGAGAVRRVRPTGMIASAMNTAATENGVELSMGPTLINNWPMVMAIKVTKV